MDDDAITETRGYANTQNRNDADTSQLGFRTRTVNFEKQYILEPTLRRLHELKIGHEVLSEAVGPSSSLACAPSFPSPCPVTDNPLGSPHGPVSPSHRMTLIIVITVINIPPLPSLALNTSPALPRTS